MGHHNQNVDSKLALHSAPLFSLLHPCLCANHHLSANLLAFCSSSHSPLGVNQFKRSTIILDLKIHEDGGSWVYETPLPPPLWTMHRRRGSVVAVRGLFIQQRKLTTCTDQISTWATHDQGQSLLPGRGLPKSSLSHTLLYKSWVAAVCGFCPGQRKVHRSVGQGNGVWEPALHLTSCGSLPTFSAS